MPSRRTKRPRQSRADAAPAAVLSELTQARISRLAKATAASGTASERYLAALAEENRDHEKVARLMRDVDDAQAAVDRELTGTEQLVGRDLAGRRRE